MCKRIHFILLKKRSMIKIRGFSIIDLRFGALKFQNIYRKKK